MLTNETLTTTYEALKAAVVTAFSTGEMAIQAKAAFETGKAALLLDGRLDGKNQEQRDAQARELLSVLYRNAEVAEKAAREAKCGLETARLDVEVVRAQLRLLELVESAAM
ncbi:MAG: hypothetical protein KC410_19140 [Anaerolineales bacterium]|uniref:hypothetical protein n=1 Tax=Promineifilum sp. TaxID=2664178 RepID=UPI001DC7C69C|nr:hypothetical protein [Anaerolineales bacterium]MCO5181121.1 hypothetical protein [Promineifilum sp.]